MSDEGGHHEPGLTGCRETIGMVAPFTAGRGA